MQEKTVGQECRRPGIGEGAGIQEKRKALAVAGRRLQVPPELQVLAVQNDRNAQTVDIWCPRWLEGRDLSPYSFFLRTVNSQGGYDAVALFPEVEGDVMRMRWELRPPQTSFEGKLSLQLWVTGQDFDWQTVEAPVRIIRQLKGEPVIPVQPSAMDTFLKLLSGIADSVRGSEENAAQSASRAQSAAAAASQHSGDAGDAAHSSQQAAESAQLAQLAAAAGGKLAQEAAELAQESAHRAAESEQNVRGFYEKAAAFSDAAGLARDTALAEAARALEAGGQAAEARSDILRMLSRLYRNAWNGGSMGIQEMFDFLFTLMRKYHSEGICWADWDALAIRWDGWEALLLTWDQFEIWKGEGARVHKPDTGAGAAAV